MRFDIDTMEFNCETIFFLMITDTTRGDLLNDDEISECLNLTLEEYHDILIQHGGQRVKEGNDIYFKSGTNMDSINIQSIVKILEPHLVLATLTE